MPPPVDMTVPIRASSIARWLTPTRPKVVAVEIGRRHRLVGGVGSPLVERVEVVAVGSGGRHRFDVVAKRASAAEVIALRELAAVPGADAFPELIDAGTDGAGPWVVTPFYPGSTMRWDAEVPGQVFASLARLHYRHLGTASGMPADLPRVDERFCRGALTDFAPSRVREAQRKAPHPVHERAMSMLDRWADDERIYAGLDLLPATLLHGDAYGLNVVVADNAAMPPRLIDWGSARVGPIMLDVAMTVERSSPGYSAYLRAWQDVAGCPLDRWQAETGHAWARAFNNATFAGVVAERFSPTHAEQMLDQAEAALNRLGHLLAGRSTGGRP